MAPNAEQRATRSLKARSDAFDIQANCVGTAITTESHRVQDADVRGECPLCEIAQVDEAMACCAAFDVRLTAANQADFYLYQDQY